MKPQAMNLHFMPMAHISFSRPTRQNDLCSSVSPVSQRTPSRPSCPIRPICLRSPERPSCPICLRSLERQSCPICPICPRSPRSPSRPRKNNLKKHPANKIICIFVTVILKTTKICHTNKWHAWKCLMPYHA